MGCVLKGVSHRRQKALWLVNRGKWIGVQFFSVGLFCGGLGVFLLFLVVKR